MNFEVIINTFRTSSKSIGGQNHLDDLFLFSNWRNEDQKTPFSLSPNLQIFEEPKAQYDVSTFYMGLESLDHDIEGVALLQIIYYYYYFFIPTYS